MNVIVGMSYIEDENSEEKEEVARGHRRDDMVESSLANSKFNLPRKNRWPIVIWTVFSVLTKFQTPFYTYSSQSP